MREPIFHMISGGPRPVAPFSHAVEADGWVILTGQMPTDPAAPDAPLPEGVAAQTVRVMENLRVVENLAVKSAAPGMITYRVQVLGGAGRLENLLSISNMFERGDGYAIEAGGIPAYADGTRTMEYRYRPPPAAVPAWRAAARAGPLAPAASRAGAPASRAGSAGRRPDSRDLP